MAISVTPEEDFEPPRNEITVAVPTGSVMTAVEIFRNDSSGRGLIRTQPSAGFDERTVYDYEAPYGEVVTYDWTATYVDPDEYTPSFTEDWSSYPTGWTGDTGDFVEADGEITAAVLDDEIVITRDVTFEWQEIEIASLLLNGAAQLQFTIDLTGDDLARHIRFTRRPGGGYYVRTDATLPVTAYITPAPEDPIRITRTTGGIIVSGGMSSVFVALDYGAINRISLYAAAGDDTIVFVGVGEIAAVTAGATFDIAEESDPVTLDSDRAWLIHPSTVALSFPLSSDSDQAAGILDVETVSNVSTVTLHPILGNREPIAVTTGTRRGDVTGMTIYTTTSDERVALRALLATDFPLLVQVPAVWAVDFSSGFYSVGEVTETRPASIGTDPWREFQLPLTKVQSPIVDVQESNWTYTNVVLTFESYSDVKGAYATYADLTTDSRI